MKVTLIHNPSAGARGGPDAESLQRLIRGAGHEVVYQSCTEELWERVLEQAQDLVAVAGGDGTVTRIAKRMAGRHVPIAVLPLGTANNVANTLGAAGAALGELTAGWASARTVRFDIGRAEGPWGSSRFIEGVGIGLFACTLPEADASETIANLDRSDAKLAYALQMLKERLRDHAPQAVSASLDGRDVSGDYVLFEAMNINYIGPNLYLAPKAHAGDGYLDLVMVTGADRGRLLAYLSSWQQGWLRPPEFPSLRGRHLKIEWSGYELHLDDEIWPGKEKAPGGACAIEVMLEGEFVEFLAPAARSAA